MNVQSRAFARKQLDQKLESFSGLIRSHPPVRGWIRAIRDALGMTGEQLARRIGVQKQRVAALEKGEVAGTATINSLKKAAEAMDCVFVYALVPRDSLEANVEQQARKYAEKIHSAIQHSMVLEQQGLTVDESGQGIKANTEKFIRETPKDIWEIN
ncbi:mobile mystery protein A [Mariprofundus ferrinatatus]|uniref:Mobile mystery protein A n=1 Tax=Mariprofundus ferrinatatus TaxID=1921087 RepID=A0A2K8LC91_9PROT|nr:mobile mystery protein A [Mariprofundus ferrinatatus]ATX81906.1 mobile mystery protein A [Mariprofundus ferrinatatus]